MPTAADETGKTNVDSQLEGRTPRVSGGVPTLLRRPSEPPVAAPQAASQPAATPPSAAEQRRLSREARQQRAQQFAEGANQVISEEDKRSADEAEAARQQRLAEAQKKRDRATGRAATREVQAANRQSEEYCRAEAERTCAPIQEAADADARAGEWKEDPRAQRTVKKYNETAPKDEQVRFGLKERFFQTAPAAQCREKYEDGCMREERKLNEQDVQERHPGRKVETVRTYSEPDWRTSMQSCTLEEVTTQNGTEVSRKRVGSCPSRKAG